MFYLALLSIALLNIVYLTGFFGLSILLKVTETEYFLGYNPSIIKVQIRNVTFNIGFYIPILGLSPIYTLVNGERRMKYPWEFSQHSLVRRFIATFGGAIGLLVTGVLIYIAQTYYTPESIISKEEINKHGIYPSEWALESGLLPGDKIVAVNGKDYQQFGDLINPKVLLAPDASYTVLRNGKQVEVKIKNMPDDFISSRQLFISLRVPFEVSEVFPGSPADQAGIKPGDRITKVNEQPVIKFTEMTNALKADDDGQVSLVVERTTNGSLNIIDIAVSPDHQKRIGILPKELIQYTEQRKSLWQAAQAGTYKAFTALTSNVYAFVKIVSAALVPRESLSGPIGIANTFVTSFWWMTAFYAMWYAFWNLLPLPKSAFWEIIPLVYEGLTKKKYPHRAFRWSVIISWVVFGGIFFWIIVNDIVKLF